METERKLMANYLIKVSIDKIRRKTKLAYLQGVQFYLMSFGKVKKTNKENVFLLSSNNKDDKITNVKNGTDWNVIPLSEKGGNK